MIDRSWNGGWGGICLKHVVLEVSRSDVYFNDTNNHSFTKKHLQVHGGNTQTKCGVPIRVIQMPGICSTYVMLGTLEKLCCLFGIFPNKMLAVGWAGQSQKKLLLNFINQTCIYAFLKVKF